MINNNKLKAVIFASSLMAFASSAVAETDKAFYVKIGGGLLSPTKSKSTLEQAGPRGNIANGSKLNPQKISSGRVTYVGFGYMLAENIRAELEFNENSGIKRSFLGEHPATKQSLKSRSLFINGYYDFVNQTAFTPYLGAGFGISQMNTGDFRVDSINYPGSYIINVAKKRKTRSFAYKLSAGVNYQLNDVVSFDLGYSFAKLGKISGIERYDAYNSSGNKVNYAQVIGSKQRSIYAHSINAGLRVHF